MNLSIEILLDLLVCPVSGSKLRFDDEYKVFVSDKAGLVYKMEHGMPSLLAEEAVPIEEFYKND